MEDALLAVEDEDVARVEARALGLVDQREPHVVGEALDPEEGGGARLVGDGPASCDLQQREEISMKPLVFGQGRSRLRQGWGPPNHSLATIIT